jgi:hypothetical protein
MPRGINQYDERRLQGLNLANANSSNIVAPGIVTDGLVLHLDAGNYVSYPASGTTWYDLSQTVDRGVLNNGPTFSRDGGGCIVFDGTNDFVSSTKTVVPSLTEWSVSVWYLSTDITSKLIFYVFSAVTGSGIYFGGNVSVDTFDRWGFFDGTNAFNNATSTFVVTNKWYNLVVTKRGTTYNLYTNGVSSLSGTGVDLSVPDYNLGRRIDDFWYAKGQIAHALLFNRALTPTEVSQNFNATRARFGI